MPNKPDGLPTGVLAAMATKIVHRKRSSLIPILVNEPIFGLYLGTPKAQEAAGESTRPFVKNALEEIRNDLRAGRNQEAWRELKEVEPM